jgi:dihydroorotate dehydrogenase
MPGAACWRITYKTCLKPLLFRQDPEQVHDWMTWLGEWLGRSRLARRLVAHAFRYAHPSLEQTIAGVHFKNPIGLAAGFDKNARLLDILPDVGFGFAEIGSVTGEPCAGNPQPRLWRLPKSQGLVVNYGLKNDGCTAISGRLARMRFRLAVGVSIAKTNASSTVETEAGIADYMKAYKALADVGAYLTINISCPNAFGGEPFTHPERLERLLIALERIPSKRPVFLKMPVDLDEEKVQQLLDVAAHHEVHGIIFSNLTKRYEQSSIEPSEREGLLKGGVSGKPMSDASNRLLTWAYRTYGSRFIYIGCGGVFSAEDAYEKIRLGASLVQLITGMIFEGPQLIGEINRGLVSLLRRDGFGSISEAVGSAHRPAPEVHERSQYSHNQVS